MLTDDTLREGMQAPGVSFSFSEKKELSHKIAACGIERILISYPPAHHSEWEIAREVSSEKIFKEVYGLGRSIVKDIDNIHSSGCHLSLHFPFQYDNLDHILEAVKYAASLDPLTEVSVVDITNYNLGGLLKIVKKLTDSNVGTIQLPDTMGKARPKLISEVVHEAKKISECRIEIHCHNDQGFSLANAIAGVESGADSVDTTFLGIGERNGITDTLSLSRYLLENGYIGKSSFDRIRELSLEFLDLIIKKAGESFFLNNLPNLGKNILTHTAGTHAAFSNIFEGSNFSVNVYTGRSMLKQILSKFNINIEEGGLSKLIEVLKDRSAEEGRVIQIKEILEEARNHVQGY